MTRIVFSCPAKDDLQIIELLEKRPCTKRKTTPNKIYVLELERTTVPREVDF